MPKLHVWPQDESGSHTPTRWNWSLSAFGLVGEHSTLGYWSVDLTVDHARWMGIEYDEVEVHTLTASQERAQGEALLAEHEAGR